MTLPPRLTDIIAAIKARDAAAPARNVTRWDTALAARVEALEAAIEQARADLVWHDTTAALRHLNAVKDTP